MLIHKCCLLFFERPFKATKNLLFNTEVDYYWVTDLQFGKPTDIIGLILNVIRTNSRWMKLGEKKCVTLFLRPRKKKKKKKKWSDNFWLCCCCCCSLAPCFPNTETSWLIMRSKLNKGFDRKPLSLSLFLPLCPLSQSKIYEDQIFCTPYYFDNLNVGEQILCKFA